MVVSLPVTQRVLECRGLPELREAVNGQADLGAPLLFRQARRLVRLRVLPLDLLLQLGQLAGGQQLAAAAALAAGLAEHHGAVKLHSLLARHAFRAGQVIAVRAPEGDGHALEHVDILGVLRLRHGQDVEVSAAAVACSVTGRSLRRPEWYRVAIMAGRWRGGRFRATVFRGRRD